MFSYNLLSHNMINFVTALWAAVAQREKEDWGERAMRMERRVQAVRGRRTPVATPSKTQRVSLLKHTSSRSRI